MGNLEPDSDAFRLDQIQQRTFAAELGPWGAETVAPDCPIYMITDHEGMPLDLYQTNADFIAHARQDIPYLLNKIKELMDQQEPSNTAQGGAEQSFEDAYRLLTKVREDVATRMSRREIPLDQRFLDGLSHAWSVLLQARNTAESVLTDE